MRIAIAILTLLIAAAPGAAQADPWKREGGPGWGRNHHPPGWARGHGPPGWARGHGKKMKYRTADGCTVERKWKKGGLEEKVKCPRGGGWRY